MKARYYVEAPGRARLLDVLVTNSDGTVNLGHGTEEEGTLVVGSCPVSASPEAGACVLEQEQVAPTPGPAAPPEEGKKAPKGAKAAK